MFWPSLLGFPVELGYVYGRAEHQDQERYVVGFALGCVVGSVVAGVTWPWIWPSSFLPRILLVLVVNLALYPSVLFSRTCLSSVTGAGARHQYDRSAESVSGLSVSVLSGLWISTELFAVCFRAAIYDQTRRRSQRYRRKNTNRKYSSPPGYSSLDAVHN